MTYEKQGEVRTVGLRDGIHKNFLLTSSPQYTASYGYVKRNIPAFQEPAKRLLEIAAVTHPRQLRGITKRQPYCPA
jgi:hypothetical protein